MRDRKTTNPKDSVGIKKVPTSTVPGCVQLEVGVAMLEGGRKYGRHNYREAGVRASVYYDATKRHLEAWWDYGQDIDPASRLHHITKAIASLIVLRDAQINGMCEDDRPPPSPIEHLDELQKRVDEIFEIHPTSLPAVTAKNCKRKKR